MNPVRGHRVAVVQLPVPEGLDILLVEQEVVGKDDQSAVEVAYCSSSWSCSIARQHCCHSCTLQKHLLSIGMGEQHRQLTPVAV